MRLSLSSVCAAARTVSVSALFLIPLACSSSPNPNDPSQQQNAYGAYPPGQYQPGQPQPAAYGTPPVGSTPSTTTPPPATSATGGGQATANPALASVATSNPLLAKTLTDLLETNGYAKFALYAIGYDGDRYMGTINVAESPATGLDLAGLGHTSQQATA